MQRILVLDVAADAGGAQSVLREQYARCCADRENRYVFCVSVGAPEMADTETVQVLRFPWVKRSWLHRLWFERFTVRRLLRREPFDRIFSLQNTAVFGTDIPQTVYLHQSLPFYDIAFSLWKQPKFWVYQHPIARRIYRSLRLAQRVIVQTEWMKRAACERAGISPEKVALEPPQVDIAQIVPWQPPAPGEGTIFFYPASNYSYKNHALLFAAMDLLAERGVTEYTLRLTLTQNELSGLAAQYPRAAARVEWCGALPQERVMEIYAVSTLVFPSYIETFGLPLLEAREAGAPILASDTPFSHEILDRYAAARFFDPFDARMLADAMEAACAHGAADVTEEARDE